MQISSKTKKSKVKLTTKHENGNIILTFVVSDTEKYVLYRNDGILYKRDSLFGTVKWFLLFNDEEILFPGSYEHASIDFLRKFWDFAIEQGFKEL
jgi:hypothetical protein